MPKPPVPAVKFDLSPRQCRAARALLDITQDDLARMSGVSLRAIQDFEAAKRRTNRATCRALINTFENMHIVFSANPEGCYFQALSDSTDASPVTTRSVDKIEDKPKRLRTRENTPNKKAHIDAKITIPVDKPLESLVSLQEFHSALAKMDVVATGQAFADAIGTNAPHSQHMGFYAAVINRLWYFGYEENSLGPAKQAQCLALAEKIMATVHSRFADKPDTLRYFDRSMAEMRKRYARAD